MSGTDASDRPRGLVFSRQFPNRAEPLRGTFVAQQVAATARTVDWRVIAPVAWPPRRGTLNLPARETVLGVSVSHPRYPVLPRRLLFSTVGACMERCSRSAFDDARCEGIRFVHAHELYPSGWAAAMLSRRARLPLVVTVHGSDLYTNLERPAWRALLSQTIDAANEVVAVSESLAADLNRAFPRARDKTVVVPDTYDAERFRYVPRPARPPERPVRLLSVGRLSSEKGYELLIAALALLRRAGTDAELTVVGEGRERARLTAAAQRAGISECVTLAGRMDGDALVRAYEEADLYVQPSRREGFGVAIVEALATGLPVVATDAGGPKDIVTASDGTLVRAGDPAALADALIDVSARLESFDAAAIARSALDRFGPATVAVSLAALYQRLLGRTVQ